MGDNITASQLGTRQREEEELNSRIAAFVETWAPEDRRDASYFHAEFHSIVRAIYADMQRPVTACLETVLLSKPMAHVIAKPGGDG